MISETTDLLATLKRYQHLQGSSWLCLQYFGAQQSTTSPGCCCCPRSHWSCWQRMFENCTSQVVFFRVQFGYRWDDTTYPLESDCAALDVLHTTLFWPYHLLIEFVWVSLALDSTSLVTGPSFDSHLRYSTASLACSLPSENVTARGPP